MSHNLLSNFQYNCKGVDGSIFSGLVAGEYTLFIEARAVDNVNEVAYDAIGPIVIIAGVGATDSEAFGKLLRNRLESLCNSAFYA